MDTSTTILLQFKIERFTGKILFNLYISQMDFFFEVFQIRKYIWILDKNGLNGSYLISHLSLLNFDIYFWYASYINIPFDI